MNKYINQICVCIEARKIEIEPSNDSGAANSYIWAIRNHPSI